MGSDCHPHLLTHREKHRFKYAFIFRIQEICDLNTLNDEWMINTCVHVYILSDEAGISGNVFDHRESTTHETFSFLAYNVIEGGES